MVGYEGDLSYWNLLFEFCDGHEQGEVRVEFKKSPGFQRLWPKHNGNGKGDLEEKFSAKERHFFFFFFFCLCSY